MAHRHWLAGKPSRRSGYITPSVTFTAVIFLSLSLSLALCNLPLPSRLPCFACPAFRPPPHRLFDIASMAPRKPGKARVTGEDHGNLGEGWSCYLGKLLIEESDQAELVLTGALSEGQAFLAG